MHKRRSLAATSIFLVAVASLGCRPAASAPPPPPPPLPIQFSNAAPPPPQGPRGRRDAPPPPPPAAGPQQTVTDTVRSFNYGPGGQVDGLVLSRGVVVHLPPEMGGEVCALAPAGTTVVATGWLHTGPAGENVLDAQTITNPATRALVSVPATPPPAPLGPRDYGPPPPAPGPPSPPPAVNPPPPAPMVPAPIARQDFVTLTGSIRQWNYGPSGEVNGFVVSNGMLAAVPPDVGAQIHSTAGVGSKVTVAGYRSVGDNNLEIITVQSVTVRGRTFGVASPGPGGVAGPPAPPPGR